MLNEELIQFPIKAHGENIYYPSYISKLIGDYVDLLKKYKISEDIICSVLKFRDEILLTLLDYYKGDHYSAYGNFKDAMKVFKYDLENWVVELEETEFFRARINTTRYNDFVPDEMFHIPFELRTKVATQRYSFPGLPCLYLGASPYVCWLELNRPSIDAFNVARIQQRKRVSLRVLDISCTPNAIKADYDRNQNEELLLNYLKIWPLIAVCSVCVRDENGSFKPEYIISQMLLQWLIIEIDVLRGSYWADGIKYFSVKATSNKSTSYQLQLNYPRLYVNYVFPIRDSDKEQGLCSKLQEKFIVTSTISGRTIQLTIPQRNTGVFIGNKPPENDNTQEKIVLPDGRTTLYSRSSFYWFEKVLSSNQDIISFDGDIFLEV